MILLASVAMLIAFTGCRHRCHKLFHKDGCCPSTTNAPPNSMLLPPTAVPTTPGPGPAPFPPPAVNPGPSFFPPPATPPKPGGPDVLLPDPLPGNPSSRVSPAPQGSNFLGAPVATKEPPKAASPAAGLPGLIKVKDGLYAGGKPSLDGFDALKRANFRTVIYLHVPGADVSAVKGMADTRGMEFVAIETTPETLATASKQFDATAASKANHPAYVFADDSMRAGAVWYLHFRNVDTQDNDVARLRAKPLGLNEQGDEGKAFWLAIQKILESK
jgi:hypothetical protein